MDDILLIAPDGGWGWMIVLSDFMVNFIIDGVIGCFGLIYPELLTEFTSSASLTSMAGSLIVGTYMCSSRYIERFSFQPGTVDLQGPETSVLLLSFSNVCVTWGQARF